VSVLAPSSLKLLGHFAKGFKPGEKAFEGLQVGDTACGVPYLPAAHAFLECRTLGEQAWGDHVIFCGEVLSGSCKDLDELPSTHVRRNGLSY
jgi:flavin reductase (DIM6/NTAB) family NADH-FMN oxidoreductase RutF